jgi:hypothetical protein
MEQRFFFFVNFSVAAVLLTFCAWYLFDSRTFYFSMFYLLSVAGSFIGAKLNPQPTKYRTVSLVTGITYPLVMAGVIIYLSELPLKTTFIQLVVFSTIAITGIGLNYYLYKRLQAKKQQIEQ